MVRDDLSRSLYKNTFLLIVFCFENPSDFLFIANKGNVKSLFLLYGLDTTLYNSERCVVSTHCINQYIQIKPPLYRNQYKFASEDFLAVPVDHYPDDKIVCPDSFDFSLCHQFVAEIHRNLVFDVCYPNKCNIGIND